MASVDAHLREIEALAERELDEQFGYAPEDHEYCEALQAMAAIGGESAADGLAAEIEQSIRKSETLPQEQSVRSLGRDLCDEKGYDIPADSWFSR